MRETEKIFTEIKEKAPDLSKKIADKVDWNVVRNTSGKTERGGKFGFGGQKKRLVFMSFALCALVLLIALPVVIFTGLLLNVKAEWYDIVLDVNPRIMLTVDGEDKVVSQSALNEDGVIFLYKKNFVGVNADKAVKSVMEEMQKLGLLSGNYVRISALSHETKKIDEAKQSLAEKAINSVLDVNTVFLSDDELEKIKDYYEEHGIAENEKTLISEFKAKVEKRVREKISDIDSLLGKLKGYAKESNEEVENFPYELRKEIADFCTKYGTKLDFDVNGNIRYKDIKDYTKDLGDSKEVLEEGLEDIEESVEDGDFGDMLEDLIELVKEEVFCRDDDD